MLIARHGGSSHYVRPDQVYRTGVLQPIVGYQPQQDVMAVAQQFTQGPYSFQAGNAGTMVASGVSGVAGPRVTLLGGPPIQFLGPRVTLLGGLGDISNLGWLQKLYLKFKAWSASRKAQQVIAASSLPSSSSGMKGLFGLGISTTRALNGFTPYGPQAWAADQVMPGVQDRINMLLVMQQKNQPAMIGVNNSNAIAQRWNILRAPTR